MNKESFLVIGSNCFSGSHFVQGALSKGFNVYGISRSDIPNQAFFPINWKKRKEETLNGKFFFFKINLNHQLDELIEIIDQYMPTYIVNFAAQGMVAESWLDPTHWYQTNVVAQVALHDQLRKRKFIKKYVHVTTPEVYGSIDEGWIKEIDSFNPTTPYAVSRAACDLHLKSFFKAYEFPVVFTRSANVYGPGQQLYRVIPRAILSARTGKLFELHGGGNSNRSFIHIDDVVSATLKIAFDAEPGTTWHISTKEAISIRKLVETICKLTSVNFESIVRLTEDRLGKDQNYLLESSSIRNKFNWCDQISLEEGLLGTIDWVDSNLEYLKQLPWNYIHKK